MKKIAVVSYSKKAGRIQCHILRRLLQGKILVERYSVEENNMEQGIQADLIISMAPIYKIAKKHLVGNGHLIVANLTILEKGFRRVLALPDRAKALVVQADMREAMHCIEQLYQLGAGHLELIPYSPGSPAAGEAAIAISPGENRNVPPFVTQIVKIGNRVLDISTLVYIFVYFRMEELFNTPEMRAYCDKIMLTNFTPGIEFVHVPSKLNDSLMTYYETGIITFSAKGFILHYNRTAERLLGESGRLAVGENVLNLFTQPAIREAIINLKPMQPKQIRIHGLDWLVKVVVGGASSAQIQYLMFEKVHETALKRSGLKKQVIGQGYTARYCFDDIQTHSDAMNKLKDIAARSALSESAILITGESGTGKELLAQAIHNASPRKDSPFVAVNCAAVPESLIESELFGYDEGAFTGARQGGKAGLFEMAHSGTVFLDEIGEMPVHLQARLLRVLQEKEITRVGGQRVISVDVRVIAATHRNLRDLIAEGTFRRDLYYRLNVIPLQIPPLRERPEDVPLLCQTFMRRIGAGYRLSGAAAECLQKHDWDGNIRELQNYTEYFQNLNKTVIEASDLPFLTEAEKNRFLSPEETKFQEKLSACGPQKLSRYRFVLESLKSLNDALIPAGRRSVAALARRQQNDLSEMEIRGLLAELEQNGLVRVCRGRKGTLLTERGADALSFIKSAPGIAKNVIL